VLCRDGNALSVSSKNLLFGPVAAIIRAKDEVDAVRIANDTIFGPGAAVFTRDVNRGGRRTFPR
jgi:acyl-CoA reductase-like NAD-dependent aldehyde dehydrogenase